MTPIVLQTSHSFHINCVERIEERKATETKWRITSLLVTFTTPKYQSDSLSLATRWGPRLYLFKDSFCFVQNSQLSICPAPARILISDDKIATSSEYRLPSIYGGHSRFWPWGHLWNSHFSPFKMTTSIYLSVFLTFLAFKWLQSHVNTR